MKFRRIIDKVIKKNPDRFGFQSRDKSESQLMINSLKSHGIRSYEISGMPGFFRLSTWMINVWPTLSNSEPDKNEISRILKAFSKRKNSFLENHSSSTSVYFYIEEEGREVHEELTHSIKLGMFPAFDGNIVSYQESTITLNFPEFKKVFSQITGGWDSDEDKEGTLNIKDLF